MSSLSACSSESSSCSSSTKGVYNSGLIINSEKYNFVVSKLREFFLKKNFIEVHTQNRLSILAACEDPFNVQTFDYAGEKWPLVQTGQMWLEYEILKKPEAAGYFCVTTSYRLEKNPVPGRHDIVFPMFEFEFKGDMEELIEMQKELLVHLGYDKKSFYLNDYKSKLNYKIAPYCEIMLKSTKVLKIHRVSTKTTRWISRRQKRLRYLSSPIF